MTHTGLASFVCTRCRQRKGKCDKVLPVCGFCRRNGGNCEYWSPQQPTLIDSPSSSRQDYSPSASVSTEVRPSTSINSNHTEQQTVQPIFPSVFFLDSDIFYRAQLVCPLPQFAVPSYVGNVIGGTNSIRHVVASFFQTVHTWIPILSKSWLYNHLLNPLSPLRADGTLLLLSIQLITWTPSMSTNPRSPTYHAAKRYLVELETAGTITLQTVQASVLIALYELGHCIYPAAYISIGTCARHAGLLGLDEDIKLGNDSNLAWEKLEERRRVWWAVLILDRFINLGKTSRMLATTDLSPNDILPADDISWEQNVYPPTEPSTTSSASQLEMGRFARFAQAIYLLGKVYRHVSEESKDDMFYEQEAAQLNRTLHALVHLSQSEGEARKLQFCTQTAVCYCALLILRYPLALKGGISTIEGHTNDYPIISPEEISRETALMCQNFLPDGTVPLAQVSPFILHLLYQACIILSRVVEKTRRDDDIRSLSTLKEAMTSINGRWLAAGEYLDILAAREAMSEVLGV